MNGTQRREEVFSGAPDAAQHLVHIALSLSLQPPPLSLVFLLLSKPCLMPCQPLTPHY